MENQASKMVISVRKKCESCGAEVPENQISVIRIGRKDEQKVCEDCNDGYYWVLDCPV